MDTNWRLKIINKKLRIIKRSWKTKRKKLKIRSKSSCRIKSRIRFQVKLTEKLRRSFKVFTKS